MIFEVIYFNILNMNIRQIFEDSDYQHMIREYCDFVKYIIGDINDSLFYSTSVRFTKHDYIYKYKDNFMCMLRDMFPEFVITFETSEQLDELNNDEMSITVDWSDCKAKFATLK